MKKVFFILSSIGVCTSISTHAKKHQKPNVIFIYADDLGKGMISGYGQKHFTTPNIDRLIKQGTQFENAYGCMLSAPARASLLTGYHDCQNNKWKISGAGHYVVDYADTGRIAQRESTINNNDINLATQDLYLPQVFKQAGYTTGQIGKLEWGFTATRSQMRNHGWDYWYGYLDHVRCHGFYPPFLFENNDIVEISGNTHKNCGKSIEQETAATLAERRDRNGKEVYSQDLFLDKIIEFIRTNKNNPFFLFHPTQLPHGPVAIPAIHPEIAKNKELTPIEKEYASMVKLLDEHIGIIITELERLGLANNTVIVFSADNGHEIYYSQRDRCEKPYRNLMNGKHFNDFDNKYNSNCGGDIFNGNAGFSGLKRSNLEGGIHVPLIFYCEKIIPKGQCINDVVSNYDFLPTMAQWLNIELQQQKSGESYLQPLLKGKTLNKNRYVVVGSNNGPAIIRNDGWKLRQYRNKNKWELFYLPTDPSEQTNLIEKEPDIFNILKKQLLEECDNNFENGINRAG
ncbi:MAG: sulfatase-like hydrolase/transferase [Marinifilaceae bacterium]